ncbi:MAG: pitrilysin family protein [Thermoanaerobaculia bacterium]|nr:pitrilysin family protein [Thermoanaerobaculia bacterium]
MPEIDIPFEKEALDNGLRVVAHHDPKTPIVTVSIWYHVGSKNERRGRTGFAHLFEHLMFEGSGHHDGEYFRPLELAGASTINGTTNRDRTNYFETVPTGALDLALWLESDRMGHLLPALDQEKLDEQRDVVRNEKRQSENQPYGRVPELLSRSLYPPEHPYSWPIIGYVEDLDAATLTDVENWFTTWYRPSNAVVVISGAIEPEKAIAAVERHFGDIPPGPPLERPGRWIARLTDDRRVELEDRVPQGRVYRAWNVPELLTPAYHQLGLVARALAQGKSSRLYRRLVYEEQIATGVSASLWSGEIGSSFLVEATAAPEIDAAVVEAALDEELDRLLDGGLVPEELERARRRTLSGFLRGVQRSGGFGGKSEVLARGEVFRGRPDAYRDALDEVATATPESVLEHVRRWLRGGSLGLTVRPHAAAPPVSAPAVERDRLPPIEPVEGLSLPAAESSRLTNDLEVVFVERHDLPLVRFVLLTDAGFAADRRSPRGTATLTMNAIDEGTGRSSAIEVSDELARLGATLGCTAGLDSCRLSMTTLAETWSDAAGLLSEILLDPVFPQHEVERLKKEQLARIRRELVTPVQLALRVLPLLLYGEDHPYGMPFTGSGSMEDVRSIDRQHLVDYHQRWLRPQRSVLLCLGDLDRAAVVERFEEILGGWEATPVEPLERRPVESPRRPCVFLLDRPGSIQSIVFGGQLVPPRNHPSELELEAFHRALGGTFTSRLNLNLREEKGWTYGAHSLLWSARGPRPLLMYASVQSDATAGTIREMDREMRQLLGPRPIEAEELDKVRQQLARSLPARWETLADIGSELEEILTCELPRDYYDGFLDRVAALTADGITETAAAHVRPDSFVWVVVGDLDSIREEVEGLDIGPVRRIDDRGRPLG